VPSSFSPDIEGVEQSSSEEAREALVPYTSRCGLADAPSPVKITRSELERDAVEGRTRLSTAEAQQIRRFLQQRGHTVSCVSYVKGHAVINAIIGGQAYVIANMERWDQMRKEVFNIGTHPSGRSGHDADPGRMADDEASREA
jgi:hypothetical protein